MNRRERTTRTGFNLVETLVASIILSGAVLTFGAISTNAMRDVSLNRHYEVAASVADKQLSLIDCGGIDEFLEMGQTQGMVDEIEPGYQWEVATDYREIDNLYIVTMTVSWMEGARLHKITVETMLNGTSTLTTAETQAQ
jgi:hypothetical protein